MANGNLSKHANTVIVRIQKILEAENVHVTGDFKFRFKNDETIEMQDLSGSNYTWSGVTKASRRK